MLEAIQNNPVLSLIILFVPVVAALWKIMDVLYIKPRDFRISVLEKNIDEIRKEIQKQEKVKEATIISSEENNNEIKVEEPEKIERIVEATTLLNDIDLFYESWKDEKLTELQRSRFEKNYIGQRAIWKATFSSASENNDGNLWVSLVSPTPRKYGVHVIAVFEPKFKESLMLINKDQIITVSGIIDSFSLSPLITNCNVVKNT